MTVHEQRIGTEDRAGWQQALEGLPHSYWHTWAACEALQRGCDQPIYLYAFEDSSGSRAACAFAERNWKGSVDIYTPAGFTGLVGTGDAPALAECWAAFARRQGYVCGYFAIHPGLPGGGHAGLVETNDLFLLDLRRGPDALLAGANRSVRRALRHWRDCNAHYVTDRAALRDFLLANYAPFMERKNANSRAILTGATLRAVCEDANVLIVGAQDEQGLCAVHTFGCTPWCAESQINISVRAGRRFTTQLLWWAINELTLRQIPWLNLGGGVSRGDALARAKQEFRPRWLPLLTAREVYRPDEYQRLCRDAPCTSHDLHGYFPPYHTPGRADPDTHD